MIAAQSGVDGRKRFIPTRVGQMRMGVEIVETMQRFIPTRVGQMKGERSSG